MTVILSMMTMLINICYLVKPQFLLFTFQVMICTSNDLRDYYDSDTINDYNEEQYLPSC